ncbi:MAG: glucose-6-phosphate isomerase [Erysipelotrichaceae bacterium]|nr:glucose-6-phosphate isomerase [Erysipelotrichaceae bacterium]
MIQTGLDITPVSEPLGYTYGPGVFGPKVEVRHLSDIRKSLMDPQCEGPEDLYAIAMDVGMESELPAMLERNLLFATCNYNYGTMGKEPVRSQGHVHAISASCNDSTCELYEIWEGTAIIYMQESVKDDPVRCYAVTAHAGDVVIVPPGWGHQTVNADITHPMVFGAWCVRDYGFDYVDVRAHGGLAYFPMVEGNTVTWVHNPNYKKCELIEKAPRKYTEFHLDYTKPLYEQFKDDPDRMLFVSKPETAADKWVNFEP